MDIDKHEELYAKFIDKLSDQDKDFYKRMIQLIPYYKKNFEYVDAAIEKTWELLKLHTSKLDNKSTLLALKNKVSALVDKNKELWKKNTKVS